LVFRKDDIKGRLKSAYKEALPEEDGKNWGRTEFPEFPLLDMREGGSPRDPWRAG